MQKLIRVLVIYNAIALTLTLAVITVTGTASSARTQDIEKRLTQLQSKLSNISAIEDSQKANTQKLDKLYSEFMQETDKKVLGDTESTPETVKVATGSVTINDKKWQSVTAYEDTSYTSKVVGSITFGKTYTYTQKDGSWYHIIISTSPQKLGWVAARFLIEE